jgi:hypothetical protein
MLLESLGYKQLLLWHRFDPDQVHQIFQAFSRSPPKPFARILPANGKIFPRDGTTVFFSSLPEPLFGSIFELRPCLTTP